MAAICELCPKTCTLQTRPNGNKMLFPDEDDEISNSLFVNDIDNHSEFLYSKLPHKCNYETIKDLGFYENVNKQFRKGE